MPIRRRLGGCSGYCLNVGWTYPDTLSGWPWPLGYATLRNASSSEIYGEVAWTTWTFGPVSLTHHAPTSLRRCPMSAKRVMLALGVMAVTLTVGAVSVG